MIFFYKEKKITLVVKKGKGKTTNMRKKGKKGRRANKNGNKNGKKGKRGNRKGIKNGKKRKRSRGKKEGRKGIRTINKMERNLPTCFSKIFKYASKLKKSRNIVSQANRINVSKSQIEGKGEKKVSVKFVVLF